MKDSKIEWCDHTFNPWVGCTKVSPGCTNCYAEARDQRFAGGAHWGKGAPRQRTSAANWKQPLRWDRDNRKAKCSCGFLTENWTKCVPADKHVAECSECGHVGLTIIRPRVFCASLADWLDDEVPIEWLADLLALIHATKNLDWLLLTKRPGNWRVRLCMALDDILKREGGTECADWLNSWLHAKPKVPANVWIGTTVEDPNRADQRIPELLKIPARVRFLSCEPLLGPVELSDVTKRADALQQLGKAALDGINWVICGGESGPNARPMHPAWARSLRDQCEAAGVPFLFKQWGEWQPYNQGTAYMDSFKQTRLLPNGPGPTAWPMYLVGKHNAGRILDGVEHNHFPKL